MRKFALTWPVALSLVLVLLALGLADCSGGGGGGDSKGGPVDRYSALRGTCFVGDVPAAGVSVTVDGKSAVSGADGRYEIRGVASGTHTATASYGGRTVSITLTWREGEYTKNDWGPKF